MFFFITDENNSFSNIIPSHWSSRGGAETVVKLQELLKRRAQKDIEVHVEQIRKKGKQIKIGNEEYVLSDLDIRKSEINKEIKNVEYNDIEDRAFRLELTYYEIENIIDKKYIDTSSTGYTLSEGIYEISDFNLMINSLLPDEVKVNITIDHIRLGSNLTTNKTIWPTKKSFFKTILVFTQSHSRPPSDIAGYVLLIPGI